MNRKQRRAAAKQQRTKEKRISLDEALGIAINLHQDGHLAEADTIYRQILEVNPRQPDALHFLGVLSHQKGDSEQAVDLIQQAISINPHHPDFHNNLGNVLKEMGRKKEAASAYQACLELNPNNTDALSNLGAVLRDEKRYVEALNTLERAIELDPKHSQAYHNLGNVLKKLERFDEAIAAYRESIKLIEPDESAVYISTVYKSLGRMLYRERRFDEAIAVYRQWLAFDPDNPTAKHMLAACSGDEIPTRAADDYVSETFDVFAESFDQVLKHLQYRAPELVLSAVKAQQSEPKRELNILDAGCGTGLLGVLIHDYARQLVGVDLSEKMIDKARERKLYDQLEVAELTGFMQDRPNSFDLIASADTLCYFGDLSQVMQAAASALHDRGMLVFSVEKALDVAPNEGYHLNPHGRYSHTEDYVTDILQSANLQIQRITSDTLRNEGGEPVEGFIVTALKA
jgi:predicted TPR repeat methyltransferase